jgi:hypothetical protein
MCVASYPSAKITKMEPENPSPKTPTACQHRRTRVIAEDQDAKYVECLDCGSILEAGEVKTSSESTGETLGDA